MLKLCLTNKINRGANDTHLPTFQGHALFAKKMVSQKFEGGLPLPRESFTINTRVLRKVRLKRNLKKLTILL